MSDHAAALGSAQELFYATLRRSEEALISLRTSRTGHPRGTQKINTARVRHRLTPSKLRVASEDSSEFEATLALLRKLTHLSNATGNIVCIGHPDEAGFCSGLTVFWTRAGKPAPTINHVETTLDVILLRNPVAICIPPERAPDHAPKGYILAAISNPEVCFLLRQEV